jgi:hypothetical protein
MEEICDWPTDMAISVQPDGECGRSFNRRVAKPSRNHRLLASAANAHHHKD